MQIDSSMLAGGLVAGVTMVIGFLLSRMINKIDQKIDALTAGHTNTLVELGILKTRVDALEKKATA